MTRVLLWGVLAACSAAPDGAGCPLDPAHLVVATTDFEVGALATVDAGGCLHDTVASTGPDPLVRALPAGLAVADRAQGDAVRLYPHGRYELPRTEFVVDAGGNVHDVVQVDGELWFALYERDHLVRTDLDGRRLGTVDLSPWADADGLPEADRLVAGTDGRLYVGLQRMIRGGSVWTPDEGVILSVDPADPTAPPVEVARPGPNPKLAPDPSAPDRLLVLTGRYGTPDGALVIVDLAAGTATPLVTEAELGFDFASIAGLDQHAVLLGVDFARDGPSRLVCVDLATGGLTDGATTDGWFVDAVAGEDRVWVGVRTGFAGASADGLRAVDPVTCDVETVVDDLALDPYGLAWVAQAPPAR